MNINWYPGHMAKTKRIMLEDISIVDIILELVDARIPISSKNPEIDILSKNKFKIIILNKADLADKNTTKNWIKYFESKNLNAMALNSFDLKQIEKIVEFARQLMKEKITRQKARGRVFVPIRSMVVGIPNVGKSTFINQIVKRKIAKTGDKPGVTRAKQWTRIRQDFELLDTPGILWPKFEDEDVALKLAFIGSIKDDILDKYKVAIQLLEYLAKKDSYIIKNRYKIEIDQADCQDKIIDKIGLARGLISKGAIVDKEKVAQIVLDEFRSAKLGNISLESPEKIIL